MAFDKLGKVAKIVALQNVNTMLELSEIYVSEAEVLEYAKTLKYKENGEVLR